MRHYKFLNQVQGFSLLLVLVAPIPNLHHIQHFQLHITRTSAFLSLFQERFISWLTSMKPFRNHSGICFTYQIPHCSQLYFLSVGEDQQWSKRVNPILNTQKFLGGLTTNIHLLLNRSTVNTSRLIHQSTPSLMFENSNSEGSITFNQLCKFSKKVTLPSSPGQELVRYDNNLPSEPQCITIDAGSDLFFSEKLCYIRWNLLPVSVPS